MEKDLTTGKFKDYFLEDNPADLEKLTTMVTSTFIDNRNKGEKNDKK